MMSWVSEYKYTWYEKLAMNVIRTGGHIPRHIAFVMDGNRRFARSEHIKKIEGHSRGFDKLADCLRWCLDVGIKEVTAFAFSIENFKRSTEEVDDLLNLAREKFEKVLDELTKLNEHGVRIKVIGNIKLLPLDLQRLFAKVVLETEQNDKLFLNVAFSYTSRDEIAQAVEVVLSQGDNVLDPNDITESLLDECMYTRHSPPPDLFFRTSGETRTSDFMMWQIPTSVLFFTKALWPQITLWHFLSGIFSYQRCSILMEPIRLGEHLHLHQTQVAARSSFSTERIQKFLQRLDSFRKTLLISLTTSVN